MSDTGNAGGDFFARFDDNPFHRYLGLELLEARPDHARMRLTITEDTPAGVGGSVNGGVIATLIDIAALPAIFAGLTEGGSQPAGTADLQVTYLRQAHGKWLDAVATVIKRGRQLCTVEVSVISDDDRLCARGRVLYALRAS